MIAIKAPERLLPVVQCMKKASGFVEVGERVDMCVKMVLKAGGACVRISAKASTMPYSLSITLSPYYFSFSI